MMLCASLTAVVMAWTLQLSRAFNVGDSMTILIQLLLDPAGPLEPSSWGWTCDTKDFWMDQPGREMLLCYLAFLAVTLFRGSSVPLF